MDDQCKPQARNQQFIEIVIGGLHESWTWLCKRVGGEGRLATFIVEHDTVRDAFHVHSIEQIRQKTLVQALESHCGV